MLIRSYSWGQICKRKGSLIEDTVHVATSTGALTGASISFSGDTFCGCELSSSKSFSSAIGRSVNVSSVRPPCPQWDVPSPQHASGFSSDTVGHCYEYRNLRARAGKNISYEIQVPAPTAEFVQRLVIMKHSSVLGSVRPATPLLTGEERGGLLWHTDLGRGWGPMQNLGIAVPAAWEFYSRPLCLALPKWRISMCVKMVFLIESLNL